MCVMPACATRLHRLGTRRKKWPQKPESGAKLAVGRDKRDLDKEPQAYRHCGCDGATLAVRMLPARTATRKHTHRHTVQARIHRSHMTESSNISAQIVPKHPPHKKPRRGCVCVCLSLLFTGFLNILSSVAGPGLQLQASFQDATPKNFSWIDPPSIELAALRRVAHLSANRRPRRRAASSSLRWRLASRERPPPREGGDQSQGKGVGAAFEKLEGHRPSMAERVPRPDRASTAVADACRCCAAYFRRIIRRQG